MNPDRNLLFAVLALQADFLDADQFVQVCTLWTDPAFLLRAALEGDGRTTIAF